MATVYRKSLKGIDELAFKSGRLTLRLTSYLLAVDGVSSSEELAARNPHLPSMDVILQGLMQQGFIELVTPLPSAAQTVAFGVQGAQGAPGALVAPLAVAPAVFAAPTINPAALAPAAVAAPAPAAMQLEAVKGNMVRDISTLLGSDAGPVISKIQNCATKDDLFAAMMGIKKIITLYVDREAAESFGSRYAVLSS
jgi:hypothetical protein